MKLGFESFFYNSRISKAELILENQKTQREENSDLKKIIKNNEKKIWNIWKKSQLNSEKIWKIRTKCKLNSEKIWKMRMKSRLNSEMIWKIWKKKIS